MFNKTAIDALREMKQNLETKYVSIFNDGSQSTDNGQDVFSRDECTINEVGSGIDYSLKHAVESLIRQGVAFDQIDIDMLFGIIYKEDTLKDGKEILPTSEAVDKKARYYTRNIHAYNNGEEVYELNEKDMVNHQGYVSFDNFVKKLKAEGLSITGPETYDELKALVESGLTEDMKISVNFQEKLEKAEAPVKKRSIFRK